MTANKKKCSKCDREKSLCDFSPHKRMALGRQSYCKQCVIEWKAANKKAVAKSHQKSDKKKRLKYLEKEKARHLTYYAVKTGGLIRPDYCESCFTESPVEGHHKDYSKPLDVEWLCRKCHSNVHNRNMVCC